MAAASSGIGRTHNPPPIAIEENSTIRKSVSCIPILGTILSLTQEIFLENKIRFVGNPSHAAELINVKNQYKIANVVRELLTIALVAFNILTPGARLSRMVISLLTFCVGMNIYGIYQNNAVINELQSTGFRLGMKVF